MLAGQGLHSCSLWAASRWTGLPRLTRPITRARPITDMIRMSPRSDGRRRRDYHMARPAPGARARYPSRHASPGPRRRIDPRSPAPRGPAGVAASESTAWETRKPAPRFQSAHTLPSSPPPPPPPQIHRARLRGRLGLRVEDPGDGGRSAGAEAKLSQAMQARSLGLRVAEGVRDRSLRSANGAGGFRLGSSLCQRRGS